MSTYLAHVDLSAPVKERIVSLARSADQMKWFSLALLEVPGLSGDLLGNLPFVYTGEMSPHPSPPAPLRSNGFFKDFDPAGLSLGMTSEQLNAMYERFMKSPSAAPVVDSDAFTRSLDAKIKADDRRRDRATMQQILKNQQQQQQRGMYQQQLYDLNMVNTMYRLEWVLNDLQNQLPLLIPAPTPPMPQQYRGK